MRRTALFVSTLAAAALAGATALASVHETWKIASAEVKGSTVVVKIDPGKVKVTAPGAVKEDEGHWHWYLDGQELGKGPKNEIIFENVSPGKHTIKVELHRGDHSLVNSQEITVNVALPKTGGSVGLLAAAGAVLVGAGLYLGRRLHR